MAQLHYWNELKKSLKEGIELEPAERDFGAYNVSELDPRVQQMMDYMRKNGEATWDQPAVAAHVGSKDAMATGWYEEGVEKPGLWANIRAKRAKGEKPARKGSEAYKKAVAAAKKINAMEEITMCEACALALLEDIKAGKHPLMEAEYQGREVPLGKPMKGDVKKYKVYVKNDSGNVVKVNFGEKGLSIKRDNPERRRSFRARHKCSQKKDRTSAGYWSCRMWSSKPVSQILKGK